MAKRRRSGEGSIFYNKKTGIYYGFVHLGYRNGKRWRKKITSKVEQEVVKKVGECTQKVRDGAVITTNRVTVAEYLRSWLENTVRDSVRYSTYKSYGDQLERYPLPRLGHLQLGNLKPQHIRQCLKELRESGGTERSAGSLKKGSPKPLSPRTVRYCRTILNEALAQAVHDGLIVRNPVESIKAPKVEQYEVEPYTPAQVRKLLAAISGDRLEALITVAVALGLRQGEILGLRWRDIDFRCKQLHVRFQLQRLDGIPKFTQPKSKNSRRTIVLPAVVVESLLRHRDRQDQIRAVAGSRWLEWDLVFPTTIGTPMEPSNLNHYFQKIASLAGLPRRRFHDLRHTAATLLLIQKVHPRLVMAILGHSQISLTMNTYSHWIVDEMGQEVADQMNEILSLDGHSETPDQLGGYSLATESGSNAVQ